MARQIRFGSTKNISFPISYKAPWALRKFLNQLYGMKSRYDMGVSNKLHREIEREIKRARMLGLLPFVKHHSLITEETTK